MLYKTKTPLCFGDYAFNCNNLEANISTSYVTQIQEVPYSNAPLFLNGTSRDFLGSLSFSIKFVAKIEDYQKIKENFFPKQGFKKLFIKFNNKILWQWAKPLNNVLDGIQPSREFGQDILELEVTMQLLNNFWNLANGSTTLVSKKPTGEIAYWDDNFTWDSSTWDTYREFALNTLESVDLDSLEGKTLKTYDNYFIPESYNIPSNWVGYSEEPNLTAQNWNSVGITATLNPTKLEVTSVVSVPRYQKTNIDMIQGVVNFAIEVKAGSLSHLRLALGSSTAGGVATSSFLAVEDGQALGGGWYRHEFSNSVTSDVNDLVATIQPRTAGNADPTSGDLFIKNWQVYPIRFFAERPAYEPKIDNNLFSDLIPNTQNAFVRVLTDNLEVANLSSEPMILETSLDSRLLLVCFRGLIKNEWVRIYNQTTDSGFKLTWLSDFASPDFLTLKINGNSTSMNETISLSDYKIELEGGQNLFFTGYQKLDFLDLSKTADLLTVQKNTTSQNIITIKNIPTYI